MPVPDYQSFFRPLLDIAIDGKEHSIRNAREQIADQVKLSSVELAQLLPSGTQRKFDNRVAWAKSYLIQPKVLSSPRRGFFKITDRGRDLHKEGHESLNIKILSRYPEFVEFRSPLNPSGTNEMMNETSDENITPEEVLQNAYQNIRAELTSEILEKIMSNSPGFFENLVVDLMLAMGYGGSKLDAGRSIGQTGDGGIDGVIKQDRLGLDVIYLQAKRWEGTVGRPEIQKFAGALQGKQADKGVFITTGKYSDDAIRYARTIRANIILIDGRELANYMIDSDLGVSTNANYKIKKINLDHFEEE